MGCEYVRFEAVLHARFIPNAIAVESQKWRASTSACRYKNTFIFVLFLFRYLDDFRDHFNIVYSTNNVVIRPMCDRGLIVDIDIVLYIQCTESTIARCKMNRLKNVFMAPAGLEAQWMLPDIGWPDHLQPQIMRPFAVCNTVSNPLITWQRRTIGLLFVNRSSMLVSTGMPAIKDHDVGLRRTNCLPSFSMNPSAISSSASRNITYSPWCKARAAFRAA